MKLKINQVVLSGLLVLSLFLNFGELAKAAEKNQETGMGFTYVNKTPDNQLKEGNFFDLMMEKGQEQVLETELTNLTDQDLTINVIVSNATTTEAGVIDYGPSQHKTTWGLRDLIEAPTSVKLPKNGKTTLKLALKMPAESIPGVVLGGIQLQQVMAGSETTKDAVSINNQYAYVYSVSLRETEEVPDFAFESAATSVDSKNQLSLNFSNQAARIIKGMTVETVVTAKDSEEVLGEQRLEELKMAPNSTIKIPLAIELGSGDYQTKTTVKVEDKSWQWVEDFSIDVQKATPKVTKISPESTPKSFNWLPLVIISGLLIMGTGVLYLVIIKN